MVWTPSLGQHPSSQVQNARNNFRRPLFQIPLKDIRPKLGRPKQVHIATLSQHSPSQVQNVWFVFRQPLFQIQCKCHPPQLERPKQNECAFQVSTNTPRSKFKMVRTTFGIARFKPFSTITQHLSTSTRMSAHAKPQPTLPKSSSKYSELFSTLLFLTPHSESIQKWSGTLMKNAAPSNATKGVSKQSC